MTRAGWLSAIVACAAAARAGAQRPLRIEAPPHARAAQPLRAVRGTPHDLMRSDTSRRIVVPRGATLPRSVIVLGGNASVGAVVRGDVIVVGGDLFLQPGADIAGRAVALGGAVYGSTLATVRSGVESFRDETFDAVETPDGLLLRYRRIPAQEPAVELPVFEGLRVPTYDRVDGASVPWGPLLRPTHGVEVEPIVTYRSHLGAWDPGLEARVDVGASTRLTMNARRATLTNDAWIHSDLVNSINALIAGSDTRNYYRADRLDVALRRTYQQPSLEAESYVGARTERAWSVGSPDTLGSRPWSVIGRDNANKFGRGNPPVRRGRISAAVVGATARWQLGDVQVRALGELEAPWQAPGDVRFVQLTADGSIQFPTFGVQRFRADLHVVATPGDTAPPQRFAYLGGSGTLPVIRPPLALGGDQLVHLDSRYEIPVERVKIPFAGSPVVALRHRIGSAGIQRLPRFVQNVGMTVTVSFVRVEYTVDPATRKQRVSAALSFAR